MKRLIIGKRGGAYGLWLSKPGVDVETASRDDMLFSTTDDRPVLNYLARGIVNLAPRESTTVFYGMTLSTIPIVFLSQRDAASDYAYDCHVQDESLRIVPYPGLSSVLFQNQTSVGGARFEGRYTIFMRPQQ